MIRDVAEDSIIYYARGIRRWVGRGAGRTAQSRRERFRFERAQTRQRTHARTHASKAAGRNIPVARRSLVVSGSVVYIHFGLGNPRNRCGPQSTNV